MVKEGKSGEGDITYICSENEENYCLFSSSVNPTVTRIWLFNVL